MNKDKNVVKIHQEAKRQKLKIHFSLDRLIEEFDAFRAVFSESNGEDAEFIKVMLEDVSNILKWLRNKDNVRVTREK